MKLHVKSLVAIAGLFFVTGVAKAAPYTVCTATLNSSQEKEEFRRALNPNDFQFVELTSYAKDKNDNNGWFEKACEAKVQCDVLVVSGHFGGSFFGQTKFTLPLSTLERQSCNSRCDGVLARPKEVFLFGCNTLASKDKDRRTPQEYLRALLEHNPDLSRTEADHIVATRYSPIGSAFKDRMERVFEGVPLVYGFHSAAPSGNNIQSSLRKYLTEVGDYRQHIEAIATGQRDTKAFERNMRVFPTAIATGISSNSLGSEIKTNACSIADEKVPSAERVALAGKVLNMDPYLYFPIVSNVFENDWMITRDIENKESAVQAELRKISQNKELKEKMLRVANLDGLGTTLQLDVFALTNTLGWVNRSDYREKVRQIMLRILTNPSRDNADVMCSLRYDHELPNIRLEQFDYAKATNSLLGLTAMACMPTKDERITKILLQNAAPWFRREKKLPLEELGATLMGVVSMPGAFAEKRKFANELPETYPGRYAKEYLSWKAALKIAFAPADEQVQAIKDFLVIKSEHGLSTLDFVISKNDKNLSPQADIYLTKLWLKDRKNDDSWYYQMRGTSPEFQNWLMSSDVTEEERVEIVDNLGERLVGHVHSGSLHDWILKDRLQNKRQSYDQRIFEVIESMPLSAQNLADIRVYMKAAKTVSWEVDAVKFFRYMLFKNRHRIPDLQPEEIKGDLYRHECSGAKRYSTCNLVKYTEVTQPR